VTPTVGFSMEEFEHGNVTFQAFDMSGEWYRDGVMFFLSPRTCWCCFCEGLLIPLNTGRSKSVPRTVEKLLPRCRRNHICGGLYRWGPNGEQDRVGLVVTNTDPTIFPQCVAHDELKSLLKHPEAVGKPILFYSNKKDRPDSMVIFNQKEYRC